MITHDPILSIIVPVYKSEQYLERCLDSILKQTYTDFELICINDGSPDNCKTILEEYRAHDDRIIIIHQENKGLSITRNRGMEISRGKYICFVDSDDYIEANMYQTLLERIEGDQSDLALCGVLIDVETKTAVLADTSRVTENEKYFNISRNEVLDMNNDIYPSINTTAWNKLYKREILQKYDLKFPESLWYEDSYFVRAYCTLIKRVSFIKNKFYHYCFHDASIMGQTVSMKTDRLPDNINVAYELYLFLENHGKMDEFAHSFFGYYRDQFWYAFRYSPHKKALKSILEVAQKHLRSIPYHNYHTTMEKNSYELFESIINNKFMKTHKPEYSIDYRHFLRTLLRIIRRKLKK